MASSGVRSTTTPNRPRPTGTGKVGDKFLTCGHVSPSQPVYRRSGDASRARNYWCDHPDCKCYRRRA